MLCAGAAFAKKNSCLVGRIFSFDTAGLHLLTFCILEPYPSKDIELAWLPNFKKGMAILILALANYLFDIVSPGGPTMFKAGRKILGFGVPRWTENAFLSLVPWTYQYAKAHHFLYYVPQSTHSPSSLKKPTPLPGFCVKTQYLLGRHLQLQKIV